MFAVILGVIFSLARPGAEGKGGESRRRAWSGSRCTPNFAFFNAKLLSRAMGTLAVSSALSAASAALAGAGSGVVARRGGTRR